MPEVTFELALGPAAKSCFSCAMSTSPFTAASTSRVGPTPPLGLYVKCLENSLWIRRALRCADKGIVIIGKIEPTPLH